MTMCKIIVTLPIPKSRSLHYEDGFSSELIDDLQLVWDVPSCEGCEEQGGMCGFNNTDSQQVTCFYDTEKGNILFVDSYIFIIYVY